MRLNVIINPLVNARFSIYEIISNNIYFKNKEMEMEIYKLID